MKHFCLPNLSETARDGRTNATHAHDFAIFASSSQQQDDLSEKIEKRPATRSPFIATSPSRDHDDETVEAFEREMLPNIQTPADAGRAENQRRKVSE